MKDHDNIPRPDGAVLKVAPPPNQDKLHGTELREELRALLNRHSAENGSNTPDFILANYLLACLTVYQRTILERARWYGRLDAIGGAVKYPPKTRDTTESESGE